MSTAFFRNFKWGSRSAEKIPHLPLKPFARTPCNIVGAGGKVVHFFRLPGRVTLSNCWPCCAK
jgi:hypothetical protein